MHAPAEAYDGTIDKRVPPAVAFDHESRRGSRRHVDRLTISRAKTGRNRGCRVSSRRLAGVRRIVGRCKETLHIRQLLNTPATSLLAARIRSSFESSSLHIHYRFARRMA